jgi:endoglucanase
MGEFGSRLETESDSKWLNALISYLGTGSDGIHWVFWSWNPNSEDTHGLLTSDWITVDTKKFNRLKPLLPAAAEPALTPAPCYTEQSHNAYGEPIAWKVLYGYIQDLQRLAIRVCR